MDLGLHFDNGSLSDCSQTLSTIPDSENAEGARETLDSSARVVRLDEADSGCGIALHFSEEMDAIAGG